MSCNNDCRQPDAFPKPISNRPGLSTIDYRIGSYADMRAHMLRAIDENEALAAWTHRLSDDPAIALVEAAAEVGDILSFYQDLYANEAWLRSAKWRDSVADLVRLLGYRLAPGLAGRARFAFAVKGTQPVLLPAGLGVKAQLEGDDKPAVFETSAALLAQPALSKFHLYRPRSVPAIRWGSDTFTLQAAAGAAPTLKAGDRLMVGVLRADGQAFEHTQVLVVDKVSTAFGATVLKMKGGITSLRAPLQFAQVQPALTTLLSSSLSSSLTSSLTSSLSTVASASLFLAAGLATATLATTPRLRAWKLGATHRHFGHNAPATDVQVSAQGRATTRQVSYVRRLNATTNAEALPALKPAQLPLEAEVGSVLAGTRLLVEVNLSANSSASAARKRLLQRRVVQVDRQSLAWGPMSGASTVLTLDEDLALVEAGITLGHADVRGVSLHEVQGEPFDLQADFVPADATSGAELHYHGTADDAAALAPRALLFAGPGGALQAAHALSAQPLGAAQPGWWRVLLDRDFDYADFGHDETPVSVYGNLVEATQGKTEAQVSLGDGDARAVFQSFALPKTPLSYLLDTTQVPAQLAQLQIWVDGVAWARVDSLFARGPKEPVYVVREDADGKSWVQFGDGKTGARLRTGRGNVQAIYRTGSGAHGLLKADAKPQLEKKPTGLDAAWLLEAVTGGAAPETADIARTAAPGAMQSLGRIVSLADYEAEALALPGVLKARAAWVSVDGAPLVRVTLLTASAAVADAHAAAEALRAAVRARGAGRCPLLVVPGQRTAVSLQLLVGADPLRRLDDVRAAVLQALGVEDEASVGASPGLFHWQQRQFGQGVHGSQVVGAVQNASGVSWVQLRALRAMPSLAAAPNTLAVAHAFTPPTQRSLACAGDSLLVLLASGLQLQITAASTAETGEEQP